MLTDSRLCDDVAAALSRPKVAEADSFVLHAPLELLARTALLPWVEPEARSAARDRLVWLRDAYRTAGEEVGEPPACAARSVADGAALLIAAIDAGDLDAADGAAAWLAGAATPSALAAVLADRVVPRLAAAGHGPILLFLLPRVAPRQRAMAGGLRGLARELARHPDWVLSWHERRSGAGAPSPDLAERLAAPASPGDAGSPFIFPTMSLTESSGLAPDLLDDATRGVGVASARRDLLRTAAAAMLQDDPAHAPYGWSHCLTMPQAVLGVVDHGADEAACVAVAATYVLGFRSTLGRTRVDIHAEPARDLAVEPLDGIDGPPAVAAASAFHAAPAEVPAVVARLASRAAAHEDAHLAKYTLACLDAAHADPEADRLFLAAAAHLNAWWRTPA